MSDEMSRTFALFPKFPPEVRLMIWNWAKPCGRIVDINQTQRSEIQEEWNLAPDAYWRNKDAEHASLEGDEHSNPSKYNKLWGYKSNTPIPALLLACRESYSVASKWYPRVFQWSAVSKGPGSVSIPQTYFNFEEDILFITPESFRAKYTSETDAEIRYNAHLEWNSPGPILPGVSRMASDPDFSRVENLAIQIDSDDWGVPWQIQGVWLSKMLERTFCNLKTLTMVVDYCVLSPHWWHWKGVKMTTADKSDLVFLKQLVDVQKTYAFYQPDRPIHPGEKEKWTKPKRNVSCYARRTTQVLFQDFMETFKKESIDNGETPWNLPKVEFKIVIPAKVKSSLIQNVLQYKQKFLGWQGLESPGSKGE